MVWDYYNGKILFITGGTGFVGTTLIYRLLTKSTPKHIYVLSRGGYVKARAKWLAMLPTAFADVLLKSDCMTILDGELGDTATMNLSNDELQMLKRKVHVIIHAAASIELKNSLRELSYTVLAPTLCLIQYALKFVNLERFVFLSTAYANAHLWNTSKCIDVAVEEKVYPLDGATSPYKNAMDVWSEVLKTGSSDEYDAHDFPWPYAYSKHLAERLILLKAAQKSALDKILILRPSVVGPADEFPYPGFATSHSTPSTVCAAAYALHPGRKIHLSTRVANPSEEATIDEVPVDVVADRLLVHVAMGTSGCVHAVSGEKGRLRMQDWWHAFKSERLLPWSVKPVWSSDSWHSPKLHITAQMFKIIGTSFAFSEKRTEELADKLSEEETEHLKLFADRSKPYSHTLVHRRHHITLVARQIAKKKKLPACLVRLLCRNGKPPIYLNEKVKR
ncbi:hypothetical protein N7495_005104 [Penicillium taxi]|uniref:uncharacterized protein n=1 Tax=Penicillium taxi TaxID=168475 RepID=UPI0025450A6E|nr:uncharacterized protein N7495_005104 [Penicillium taxi]KAJ5893413.1 hypothetical protein N7495_005104 [Penicillium taxi]